MPTEIMALSANNENDFIPPNVSIDQLTSATGSQTPAIPFANYIAQGLQAVDQSIKASEQASLELATGKATNLHQVMITMEQSKLDLQLATKIQNKLLQAYQDISQTRF